MSRELAIIHAEDGGSDGDNEYDMDRVNAGCIIKKELVLESNKVELKDLRLLLADAQPDDDILPDYSHATHQDEETDDEGDPNDEVVTQDMD